jgi:hypothetical protein
MKPEDARAPARELNTFADLASPWIHAAPIGLAGRFLIRIRLYAAASNLNIHPTFSIPRCRTLRMRAIVFSHSKHSSMRLCFFWLTAHPSCRMVRSSMALPPLQVGSHLHVSAFRHKVSRVISLVGSYRNPALAWSLFQHHQRRVPFDVTSDEHFTVDGTLIGA